jgi:predicted TIM-barrel fold metal-dependent hydrolase
LIIDFHTHIFPPEVLTNREAYLQKDAWFTECYTNPRARAVGCDTLVASMDEAGIDKSVVCGFSWGDHDLCVYHNDYIIESVRRYPERLIGFAIVQPNDRRAVAELERCAAAGLRGAGELNADAQTIDLLDFSRIAPFVNTLDELGLPLLLHASEPVGHTYPGKGSASPDILYRFISHFPDLKLVCAHWGGGLPFYELMPEVAAATSNVYYDTAASSLLYQARIFGLVPAIVGANKVLFGTDYPILKQTKLLNQVRELRLDPTITASILGTNAQRLLNI